MKILTFLLLITTAYAQEVYFLADKPISTAGVRLPDAWSADGDLEFWAGQPTPGGTVEAFSGNLSFQFENYRIELDLQTGEVTLPPGQDLPASAKAFWLAIDSGFSGARAQIVRQTQGRDEFELGVVYALLAIKSGASIADTVEKARQLRVLVDRKTE
jgi:hypothetical protein